MNGEVERGVGVCMFVYGGRKWGGGWGGYSKNYITLSDYIGLD